MSGLQQRLVDALYGPGHTRSESVEELADALIAVATSAFAAIDRNRRAALPPDTEEPTKYHLGNGDIWSADDLAEVAPQRAVHPAPTTTITPEGEGEDWRDDPSADERWNAGLDFAMEQLCAFLGVDPKSVVWDAATETVDGDVQSVMGNIMRAKFGEDWGPNASPSPAKPAEGVREALTDDGRLIPTVGHIFSFVARPPELEEKDWKGWDLAMQAVITAHREASRAALSGRDAVLWRHETPFITSSSGPDGDKFISVKVRTYDALHDAHDLVIRAFKAAGAK